MSACCSGFRDGARRQFDAGVAAGDLERYRKRGPRPATKLLRDGVLAANGTGTLLDVGAGIGSLSQELLARGFAHATLVDASPAYLAAARRAAGERGLEGRMEFHEGDFVERAGQLAPADAVVLDRVVCCYPAYRPLLEAALDHSRHLFAFSYPRGRWYVRAMMGLENVISAWKKCAFRAFVHSEAAMAAVLTARGFRRVSRRHTMIWCVDVYARDVATGASSPG
jgi:predicted RNA methylase